MLTDISLLDTNKTYTYANYLTWRFQERIELIKGKLFKMAPAPARKHQQSSLELTRQISNFLFKKECKIYTAPFDVRFPKGEGDDQVFTVVQPDICVICDKSKLDDRGCVGAPDFIIEILSPATAKKDVKDKFQLYQEYGVREYWIVSPEDKIVDVFLLDDSGKYQLIGKYTEDDLIKVNIFEGLNISLAEVFEDE
jgi:Uma2 family endonuclease